MRRADKQPVRPGPPGTGSLVVEPSYKLAGAARGRARKRTPKQLAALDEGRRRTKADRALVALTGRPDAVEVERTYEIAGDGDFGPLTKLNLRRQARLSLLHDAAVEEAERGGIVSTEDVFDSNGNVVSSRKRVNPAAEFALKSAATIGIDADQMAITPSARGAAKADDAISRFLDRQARLRGSLLLNRANAVTVEVEKVESEEK